MLVLSRKEGESILIADNIKITISEVRGSRVKLAIEAPLDVKILRMDDLPRKFPPKVQNPPKKSQQHPLMNQEDVLAATRRGSIEEPSS